VNARARLRIERRERRVDPPQANARGTWTERTGLELSLRDALGRHGRGEAAPLPDYSPDLLEGCEQALHGLDDAAFDALDAADTVVELLDAAAAALPAALPAARFALETALLDRAARRAGQPLWRQLRELVPGAGEPESVALCALLPSADPAAAVELARAHVDAGVSTFKLKVGPDRPSSAQEATLDALRTRFGASLKLRLDANGSLSRDYFVQSMARLARYGLEFLEEPLAFPEPEELAGSSCSLALDESLQHVHPTRLARLLALDCVRVVVLKPTALGGFRACLRLASSARAQGCDAVVSHTLEGPIGWAACAHLALALPSPRAAGLWPLAHQLAPAPRITRGRLFPPNEPGLGGPP
jgi:o-succinylbenzoate synthase